MVGETLHFYELQLQLPCSCEEFAVGLKGISELISKHGKQPEVCTINAILNSSHSTPILTQAGYSNTKSRICSST